MDSLKVLLIEDNAVAQTAAKANLELLNCQVDVASSSSEALSLLSKQKYDVIFMDIGLDEMDGYILTRKIREGSDKNKDTPIIALTAQQDPLVEEIGTQAGMNAVITKPLTKDVAKSVLEKFLPK